MVWALINEINKVPVSGDGFTRPGDYIYELLNQVLNDSEASREHSFGMLITPWAGGRERGHVGFSKDSL
jgi:hypothetical protein